MYTDVSLYVLLMLSAKNHGVFVLLIGLGTGADVTGTVELHLSRHVILILIYLLTAVGVTPCCSSTVQYSTVQYTSTHKQYTEQHNETEYTGQNIQYNKNT
jgi:diacylglycerol kinase family enzyme